MNQNIFIPLMLFTALTLAIIASLVDINGILQLKFFIISILIVTTISLYALWRHWAILMQFAKNDYSFILPKVFNKSSKVKLNSYYSETKCQTFESKYLFSALSHHPPLVTLSPVVHSSSYHICFFEVHAYFEPAKGELFYLSHNQHSDKSLNEEIEQFIFYRTFQSILDQHQIRPKPFAYIYPISWHLLNSEQFKLLVTHMPLPNIIFHCTEDIIDDNIIIPDFLSLSRHLFWMIPLSVYEKFKSKFHIPPSFVSIQFDEVTQLNNDNNYMELLSNGSQLIVQNITSKEALIPLLHNHSHLVKTIDFVEGKAFGLERVLNRKGN